MIRESKKALLRSDKDAVELVQCAAVGSCAVLGKSFWGQIAGKPRCSVWAAAARTAGALVVLGLDVAIEQRVERWQRSRGWRC